MNIDHLNQITPEFVSSMERRVEAVDKQTGWHTIPPDEHLGIAFTQYRHVIIAALHAGLRLRRELDQTITTP